ncbi:MAG: hypothetical protein AAGA86_10130, partial [Bacteroidota bacterium]
GNGTFTLNFTDGTSFTTADLTGPAGTNGTDGTDGTDGTNGADGNGIASTVDNGNGTFTLNFTDGTSFTTADLTGPAGTNGTNGTNGTDGANGTNGADGNGIASTVDNGNGTFTLNFTDGTSFTTADLTGPAGANGTNGTNKD